MTTQPKPLLLDSKVSLEIDPSLGFLKAVSVLGEKTGLNLVTCLDDRKPESAKKLVFAQTSVREVLDRIAAIFRVRWRVLASESREGRFILWETEIAADSKSRWGRLKDEVAREAKEQGWFVPKTPQEAIMQGISRPIAVEYSKFLSQLLPIFDSRLDAATVGRLGASGLPFTQLPNDIQASFRNLGQQTDRLRTIRLVDQILYWISN
ncbi:MAG: hypothetical protein IT210_19635 [Armatimonadetes bacterium]|nr:hypothetical protein [Armatimonadota bacterium]